MTDFGELKKIPLSQIWPHEALHFTPWLEDNIKALGDALGLELEVIEREASVGGFSLDLLAKEIGSSKTVIIENQFNKADHDHLGKLLTYAAGFDASIIIWIFETIREEYRQTMEWLNQRTDTETQFFALALEVLKIDDSKPVYNFKPVVFPNEWQKSKKQKLSANTSPRSEKYKAYFQVLTDELRDVHKFTGVRSAQLQNWAGFASGVQGILYSAVFGHGGKIRTEVYIDRYNQEMNKALFDALEGRKNEIEASYGSQLTWERLDEKQASRISIYRDGKIDGDENELEEIKKWFIENLLKIKEVFTPEIKQALEKLNNTN